MKRLVLLALSVLLVTFAMAPVSVDAQTTCSCPWQVNQGSNSGASDCASGHGYNERNLKSYAFWMCGNHTPCTTVYTPLSCTTNDPYTDVTATGLLNYKCC
jgi:hypothetical protein